MSPLVKLCDNCTPTRFEPPVPKGESWLTGVVSVKDMPSPSTMLIWTSSKIVVFGSVLRTPNFQVCVLPFLESDSFCFQVAWLSCGALTWTPVTVTVTLAEWVSVPLVPVTMTV